MAPYSTTAALAGAVEDDGGGGDGDGIGRSGGVGHEAGQGHGGVHVDDGIAGVAAATPRVVPAPVVEKSTPFREEATVLLTKQVEGVPALSTQAVSPLLSSLVTGGIAVAGGTSRAVVPTLATSRLMRAHGVTDDGQDRHVAVVYNLGGAHATTLVGTSRGTSAAGGQGRDGRGSVKGVTGGQGVENREILRRGTRHIDAVDDVGQGDVGGGRQGLDGVGSACSGQDGDPPQGRTVGGRRAAATAV